MNCNQNSGCPPRRPVPGPQGPGPCRPEVYPPRPVPMPYPGLGPVVIGPNHTAGFERYPVGMGYVPVQSWEAPFPMDRAFQRGTIFPSLDYPFVMGRCRG